MRAAGPVTVMLLLCGSCVDNYRSTLAEPDPTDSIAERHTPAMRPAGWPATIKQDPFETVDGDEPLSDADLKEWGY